MNISQLKKVEAEIREDKFADVDSALRRIGVPGLTFAQEERASRGALAYPAENVRHLILTVVVDDAGARNVVESIRDSAWAGSWADGRIAVTTLDGVLDIGSGLSDHSELAVPSLGV